MSDEKSLQAPS